MDKDVLARINPIYKNEQEYIKHLAAAGVENALKIYEALDLGKDIGNPGEVTPDLKELADDPGLSYTVIEKSIEVADEARFLMTNEMIRGYEPTNVIELPCGYTPRGLIMANEGYKYIGLDLPIVISDIGPAVRDLSDKYSHRIVYKSMDATNFGSISHALENVNGEISVVSEVMLSYLNDSELISVCDNIYKLLSLKGGNWIIMDIGCRDLYRNAFRCLSQDNGDAMYENLIKHFKKASDIDLYSNSLYTEGSEGAESFLKFRGFDIEKVSVSEVLPELSSLKDMPDVYDKLKEAFSKMEYWTLTASKRHGTRIINTHSQGYSVDKKTGSGFLYLGISGRLDTITAPDLLSVYEEASKDAPLEKITLDCRNLEYISSAGLRVLLIMLKKLKNPNGMTVRNVSAPVMDIFETTGFTDLIGNISRA